MHILSFCMYILAIGGFGNVVSLAEGKLQFEVLKKGSGQMVQPYNSPLVRLKNGENEISVKEEILPLDETMPGLKLGIVGMREGEIRKFYIHPELSNEEQKLLVVEVEIIKADASSDAHAASNTDSLPIFRSLDDVRPLIR